jgi:hypothetical protein
MNGQNSPDDELDGAAHKPGPRDLPPNVQQANSGTLTTKENTLLTGVFSPFLGMSKYWLSRIFLCRISGDGNFLMTKF